MCQHCRPQGIGTVEGKELNIVIGRMKVVTTNRETDKKAGNH